MPISVSFDIKGVDLINKRLNKIEKSCKDLTNAWKKIGKDFRETEEKVFTGQGSYGSRGRWVKLSPKYEAYKNRTHPGKPILQKTGDLKRSLTQKGGNNIEIIEPMKITLGTNDVKLKYHQKGTKKMPARPPITITKYQTDKWVKIIRDEILRGF